MRFLLYNVRYGTGIGPRFHLPVPYAGLLKRTTCNLECIVSFIDSVKPDIVGLIEIDIGSFRSENMCQAEAIARQLGYSHVVEAKYGAQGVASRVPVLNKQGNAVLARQKIDAYRFHYFHEGFKRLVIEVRLPDVTIFLVHLSLTFRNRQHQLQRLFQLVSKVEGPLIVAGDFNVLWGNRELELFLAASGLVSANYQGLPSHPSRRPKRQLDYILHSPDLEASNFHIPQVFYSDHVPLICDFKLKSGAKAG
ncbi:MAG: endonuclease/exonuclease/phosphatase family protein [Desulfobulbaceae bacterium]|jgi:endonuclease/exonuclease/phosphatase family metal-dependent hydrolase|nr:endonuclease/exonuclease/phosphatase family protein [Desulfobulbaceae bacterium]MDY0351893.1 endonuclease/exonuclease/phosphatase family protein [Desulfobulbaceae bacterium]